jgi:hypothetical protein
MSASKHCATGLFLGVAEEEKSHMVGRYTLKVSLQNDFKSNSMGAIRNKNPTDVFIKLSRGNLAYTCGIKLDLIFTDRRIHDAFEAQYDNPNPSRTDQKPEPDFQVNKVLNIDLGRANRTILEVKVKGVEKTMVLKCVDCKFKDAVDNSVETIAQQEIKAFDSLPESLKGVFVEKYAHGRLWFDNSSYEVILMEQMYLTDMNQAFIQTEYKLGDIQQLKWMAQAFGLLQKVHKAGYSHGDPHAGNLLWTDGIGQGTMKFIDPERMLNLTRNGIENETKAIRKLSDVGYLLFRNQLIYQGIITEDPAHDFEISCEILHMRLKLIKSHLPESFVFLDDTLPYTNDFINSGIWSIANAKYMWEDGNPTQYQKLTTEEFGKNLDDFIANMSDPAYIEKVFHYIIMEINRSVLKVVRIDDKDLDIPKVQHTSVTSTHFPI